MKEEYQKEMEMLKQKQKIKLKELKDVLMLSRVDGPNVMPSYVLLKKVFKEDTKNNSELCCKLGFGFLYPF